MEEEAPLLTAHFRVTPPTVSALYEALLGRPTAQKKNTKNQIVASFSLLELPRASADGTRLRGLRLQPLGDAGQVKRVGASPPHDRRVVSRELGFRRAAVERRAADAAHVVARVPRPVGHRLPRENLHAQPGWRLHSHDSLCWGTRCCCLSRGLGRSLWCWS